MERCCGGPEAPHQVERTGGRLTPWVYRMWSLSAKIKHYAGRLAFYDARDDSAPVEDSSQRSPSAVWPGRHHANRDKR